MKLELRSRGNYSGVVGEAGDVERLRVELENRKEALEALQNVWSVSLRDLEAAVGDEIDAGESEVAAKEKLCARLDEIQSELLENNRCITKLNSEIREFVSTRAADAAAPAGRIERPDVLRRGAEGAVAGSPARKRRKLDSAVTSSDVGDFASKGRGLEDVQGKEADPRLEVLRNCLEKENEALKKLRDQYGALKDTGRSAVSSVEALEKECRVLRDVVPETQGDIAELTKIQQENLGLAAQLRAIDRELVGCNSRIESLKANIRKASVLREQLVLGREHKADSVREKEDLQSSLVELSVLYECAAMDSSAVAASGVDAESGSLQSAAESTQTEGVQRRSADEEARKALNARISALQRANSELLKQMENLERAVPERLQKVMRMYETVEQSAREEEEDLHKELAEIGDTVKGKDDT